MPTGMFSANGQSREQLLSTLRTAKNALEYLTSNDWMLFIDRATRLHFKKSEDLIRQGTPVKVLYLIASGKVNVSVSGVPLAQLGPGQVCGEMAFLEDSVPSATVTAEQDVEAYALEWKELKDLFELFPHLASRFHRSLAVNLSRRLREQILRHRTER
jgi:CRP-like cAMP-binding protein